MNDGITVIAGLMNGSIYKSLDEGLTWSYLWRHPSNTRIVMVFVDSRNYIFLSAFGSDGLYRSVDGGSSWIKVWSDNGAWVEQHCITEDDLGNLYVGTYISSGVARVWKSSDGGTTWFKVFDAETYFGVTKKHIHHVRFSPISKCIYALVGNIPESGTGVDGFELRSSDYGNTWENIISFDNWIGIGFKDGGLYLSTDGHPAHGAAWNRVYRLEDKSSGAVSQPSFANEVWGYNITYNGYRALPDDQYIWWFRTTLDNKFILMGGGPCSNSPDGYVHIWYSETGDKNTWNWIVRQKQQEGVGFVKASHKWSKNGWLFISNLPKLGIRIRREPISKSSLFKTLSFIDYLIIGGIVHVI